MKQKIKVLSHNYTSNSLVVIYTDAQGKVQRAFVNKSHANWLPVEKAYKAKNFDKVIELSDVSASIKSQSKGKFVVNQDGVFYDGEKAHGFLFEQIMFFFKNGLDHMRLVRFAEKLYSNPEKEVREDLYKFLANRSMPLTDDGCFLAYKGVRADYYSITAGRQKLVKGKADTSGRVFNGVSEQIEVERQTGKSLRQECSDYGIHIGSYEYANGFKSDGRLMICKVNPENVVGIPTYENGKIRVLAYEVIAEEGRALDEVADANFEKVARKNNKTKQVLKRNSLGRFV